MMHQLLIPLNSKGEEGPEKLGRGVQGGGGGGGKGVRGGLAGGGWGGWGGWGGVGGGVGPQGHQQVYVWQTQGKVAEIFWMDTANTQMTIGAKKLSVTRTAESYVMTSATQLYIRQALAADSPNTIC